MNRRRHLALAFLVLLAVGGGLYASARGRSTVRREPGLNVLLVTIDTLRADALGSYGNRRGRDSCPRPPGRGRGAVRAGTGPQRRHPALARQHPFRPLPVPAWLARQRGLSLSGGNGHPRHPAEGPRLSHGRVRERVPARLALRPRPRVRPLRRPARRSGEGPVVPHDRTRRGGDRGGGAAIRGRGARPPLLLLRAPLRAPRSLRAAGARSPRASRTLPTRARSPPPTKPSDRCSIPCCVRAATGEPSSSSPRITASPWASTGRRPTGSSPTRPRCASP